MVYKTHTERSIINQTLCTHYPVLLITSSQSIVFQKIRNAVVEIDVPALRVACGCTRSLQSCLTLYDAMDCSLLGSSLHMILQVRILEWIAMPSFRGSSQPRD